MNYRGLAVIGAVVCAAALPLLPACTAPDPGAITFVARPGSGTNPADENGDSTSSGALPPSDAGSSGTPPPGDGGTGAVTAASIFGKDAFAFTDPGETANGQAAPHVAPMQGKACGAAGCHGDPTPAGPKWAGAGSVYAAAAGGAFAQAQKIELRIVDPTGKIIGAPFYPDADGNFWLDTGGTTLITDGSHVAIRSSTGTPMMMSETLTAATGANCNAAGCHGDATNRIYAP